MYIRAHEKYPQFLSDINGTWIFSTHTYIDIKFHENPSSRSRVVPLGRTDGHTDMTKLSVDFRNFTSAPKNGEWDLDIPYVGERQPVWTSSELDNCVDPGTVPLPTRLTHMTGTVYRSIEHSYLFRSHRPQYNLFHKVLAHHTANYATRLGRKLYLRLI
jgi:hypothetical protein